MHPRDAYLFAQADHTDPLSAYARRHAAMLREECLTDDSDDPGCTPFDAGWDATDATCDAGDDQ